MVDQRRLRIVPPLPTQGEHVRAPVDSAQRVPLLKWTENHDNRQATKRDLCDVLRALGFTTVIYEWTVPELRRAIRIELERRARGSDLESKIEAEEQAHRTGRCPRCGHKATAFSRFNGRWTWSCLEGCNP